jgi:Fe-S-cluster containining protein
MEILIDAMLVRAIVGTERGQALSEIDALGAVKAYERSRPRHDSRLSSAGDADSLACKPGCSWCCHFPVDVRAVEVFAILDFVERELDADAQQRLRAEVSVNANALSGMSELQRMQRNHKCAFLQSDRCSIYQARPQTCRNYHATDVAGCELSFREPDNLDIDPEFAPLVYQSGGAHVDAFASALRDKGLDTAAYELNAALSAALQNPQEARRRYLNGQEPFPALQRLEVEPEFLDIDAPDS